MGLIRRRALFVQDVLGAWLYIARDNEPAADRYVHDLEDRFELLSDHPLLGAQRFEKRPSLRIYPFRSHLIIYEPLTGERGIRLIRLLHAARDYHRFFNE